MVQRVDSGTVRCAHFKGHFDSKTCILGVPGDHFGTLGVHFGALGSQGTPKVSPSAKREVSGRFCALDLGTHFGTFSHTNYKQLTV